MAEYIDRETLIKFPIRRDHCDNEHANEHFINGIETVMEYAENLPTADVEPVKRWIPCSERLPESCTDATYLAYVPSFGAVDIADYHPDVDEWDFMGLPVTVTHWMPLPEPPKMDGGGEDG